MATKPDDIPQDVWDLAARVHLAWLEDDGPTVIARAITAEREACAEAVFNENKTYGWSGNRMELAAYIQSRSDAAAAIRARS